MCVVWHLSTEEDNEKYTELNSEAPEYEQECDIGVLVRFSQNWCLSVNYLSACLLHGT